MCFIQLSILKYALGVAYLRNLIHMFNLSCPRASDLNGRTVAVETRKIRMQPRVGS